MIERASTSMLQGALLTVESWLNALPPSLLRNRPGLLSIRGVIAYMKGNLREGLNLLTQAEQSFRQINEQTGLILTLLRRATAHRFLGDYDASLRDADEVIQLVEADDDHQLYYAEALRVKGLALYRLGQARQSLNFFESSLNLYVRLNRTANIPVLLMETGMVYQAIGSYAESGAANEKALQIWRKEGNLSWQANLLNNLGVLRHIQGEYEKAALAFEEGLVCARRSGYARMEALIAIGLGDLSTELEDFNVAQLNYRHAEEIVREMGDRFLLFYLAMAQSVLMLLQKRITEARELIAQVRSGDSLYEKGLLNFVLGRLSLADGDASQSIHELEEAERCFLEDGRRMECDSSRIWLMAARHQTKDDMAVRKIMANVFGGRGQIAHGILVTAHQARSWLNGLQKDAEAGRMAGDLLMRASRVAAKMPAIRRNLHRMSHVVQIPNPHLIIRAFGKSSISVGGKLLTLKDWQTQSVRDLFFYFLTSQKPLTREQVGDTLWPEIDDPQKIKLRFKNDIYRLRRAVGQEVVTYEDVFYGFNRALDFEYDVEAFESFLARAKLTNEIEEQIALYKQAVALVIGPFLDDIYAGWAMLERDRLSQVYLTALLTLSELLLKQAQPEEALAACQRALEYDIAFEAAYALSMLIYDRMGDRASIIRTYQACVDALNRQLGFPPRMTPNSYTVA
ncbi:tetratricopeptide repeat protein [Candidatus Villigracilis proximus]|uniref:tetratricopeptide repeat protein n=1 Tax=Candidatus Villigracilis proximus TaxID=3140683 RepID=UPI0031E6CFBE